MAYTGTYPNIQYTNTSGDIELVTEVRSLINEPVELFCTNTQIQNWLDRGAVEAARLAKCGENGNPVGDRAFIELATATYVYNLPTEIFAHADAGNMYDYELEIESLFVTGVAKAVAEADQTEASGWALAHLDMRHAGRLDTSATGKPKYWCRAYESPVAGVHDHQLYIWPAPPGAGTYNGFAVEILYRSVPKTLKAADGGSASDAQYLPEVLREDPIYYAAAQAFKRRKMYNQANMYETLFRNLVLFHRQDLYEKPVDSMDMLQWPDYTQVQQ